MRKGKIVYFNLLLIGIFLVSTMFFSYAFFTNKVEGNGKLNIIVGTLDYKIASNDLIDNKITVKAHEIEKVELSIKSLNTIKSLYELYYNTDNNTGIEIGYSIDSTDKVNGEIDANSKKKVTVIIKNNSDTDKVINLGVEGGLINNNLVLTKGKSLNKEINLCNYEEGETFTFDYTGDSQLFTTLCPGNYQVELWGASGGDYEDNPGGQGGYTKGTVYLDQAENLYLFVGSKPTSYNGGYNGGATGGKITTDGNYTGGGGSTDIRLISGTWNSFDSLKTRIMVSAAGAGSGYYKGNLTGGSAGGLEGYVGELNSHNASNIHSVATAGTQTNGGVGINSYYVGEGKFGYSTLSNTYYGTGGGSGYYAGGSGGATDLNVSAGAGGSSFISGHDGCDAIKEESTEDSIIHTGQSIHYSGYSFRDTVMIDGKGYNWTTEKGNVVVGMPTHDGTSTMTGNSGNGYAKITYLGQTNNIYDIYKIGDEVTLKDGSKWHVLEYSSNDNQYVTLLSDYNLNSDGTYNDECGIDINGTYECGTMAFDPDNTNIYDDNDSNNIGYFIKNTYAPLVNNKLTGVTNITIPTAEQIASADSKIFNENSISLTNKWLLTTNYWTQNANTSNTFSAWFVFSYYSIINHNSAYDPNFIGVRPVITTLKSNIVDTISSTTNLAIGTPVEAVDGSKWHVLEASGSDNKYVTLLSDYNLNSDGSYNTECGRDINGIYACSTIAFDGDGTNIYSENDSNNIGYFIKNTYTPLIKNKLLQTTNITIPEASQIALADSQTFNQESLTLVSSWLMNASYWTKTEITSNSNRMWCVSGYYSRISGNNIDNPDGCGARPVITTLKTNLLEE